MSILYEAVEPISQLLPTINRYDGDGTDRLNQKYSTLVFIILAIITATNQYYVGEIIKCWAPAQFPDSWVEYTNSICWSSNTYYIPMSETNILEAPRKEIVYYQWVPLVLFLQALMFFIPCAHWAVLNRSLGMDINKIVKLCHDSDYINPEWRDKTFEFLVKHIHRAIKYTRPLTSNACVKFKAKLAQVGCFCGKRYGNYLTIIYLITKVLYIGNVCLQLYMMNHFLGTDYIIYGIEVLQDVRESGSFKESPRFPRVALCDFQVRAVGRNIPYTVQCTLPINLFNEKIFIFVWFWLAFVLVANIAGISTWVWILFTTNRHSYFKKYLKVFRKYDKKINKAKLVRFSDDYLRQDGHFLLRMIAKNTNEVVVGELIDALWDNYDTDEFGHV